MTSGFARRSQLTCGFPSGWFVLSHINSGCLAAQPRPKTGRRTLRIDSTSPRTQPE